MPQFAGVSGYPDGYSEPREAFREHLASPLHDRSLRRADAVAPAGAVTLTGEWPVVLPPRAGQQLRTAVEDFRRFMAVAMGVPVAVGAGETPWLPELEMVLAPHEFAPEAYAITVAAEGIALRAGNETGLQYALYDLEERLAEAGGPWLEPGTVNRAPFLEARILRSFFSPFYVNELLDDVDYYPPEYLARLAHHRVNGVWIHVVLRDIVPSTHFPEFGAQSAQMLAKLRRTVAQAADYGIRVYLYLNEPRGLPQEDPFWAAHPEVQGAPASAPMEGFPNTFSMCTSEQRVLDWLTESSNRLFSEVPGLGGAFLITASEHQTHCFSHVGQGCGVENEDCFRATVECLRCAERTPEAAVIETVQAIAEGIHGAAPQAKVIAWDWSWSMLWGEETTDRIVAGLPADVILQCDFERGDEKVVLGKTLWMDEYALSLIGPSRRFRRCQEVAKQSNRPVYVKLQFLATHELADVPWTPMPGIVYDKFAALRAHGVRGMLGCWIMGNYPGMITDLAGRQYFGDPANMSVPPDREEALNGLAQQYFGPEAVPGVRQAWDEFARAWDFYPFHIPMLYDGPQVAGPGLPWFLEPIHRRFPPNYLADQPPGDNLLHQILDGQVVWLDAALEQILVHWALGVEALEQAIAALPAPGLAQHQEYGLARCIYYQMATFRNTLRFYVEREFLLRSTDEAERRAILARLQGYIREELANREACLPFVEADCRLGWHSECFGYQFTPENIRQEITRLREMAEVTIPAWLAAGTGLVPPQPYAEPLSAQPYEDIREQLPNLDLIRGIYPR
ncbi:MAG TPA: hypothetical protein VGM19_03720 [Armatimonadota bacterium]|jgi:hypothetical protein